MVNWSIYLVCFLALLAGSWVADTKFLRRMCIAGFVYLAVLLVYYYPIVQADYLEFKAHPLFHPAGITAAFRFQRPLMLLGSMLFIKGILPLGFCFVIYTAFRWLKESPASQYPQA